MKNNSSIKSARQVQKSFAKITTAVGTPANAPKSRGIQLGRQTGKKITRRIPSPIIFKGELALQSSAT